MNFGDPIFLNALGFLISFVWVAAPWFFPYVCGMIVYHFITGRPVRVIVWLFSILLYCFLFACYVVLAVLSAVWVDGNSIILGISTLIFLGQTVYWGLSQRRNKSSTRALRAKNAVIFWISVLLTVIALGAFVPQSHVKWDFLHPPWYQSEEERAKKVQESELRMMQHFAYVGFQKYPGAIEFRWCIVHCTLEHNLNCFDTLNFKAKGDANDVLSFYKGCAEKAGLEATIYETGTYGPMLLAIGGNGKAMLLYRQGEDNWFFRAHDHLIQPDSFEDHIKRRFNLDSPR